MAIKKVAIKPVLTTKVIAILEVIFPVAVYRTQNTTLMNAPTMHPTINFIDAYYHDDDKPY